MPNNRVGRVLEQLRHITDLTDAQTSDKQLLAAFLDRRDEAAFAVLVRRYGPLVLGVCRRVLRHEADAADAFQATFLVLVRRADQAARRASLANWLYGVAYRTALHARSANARRRRLEAKVRPMERDESPADAALHSELQQLLDQELNALPEKYRAVLVLCDLLGNTKREAAQQLHCPEGTVSSRLARGRELLRKRLTRHGPALSLAALATLLEQNKAPASAPLIDTTVKTAALLAAGKTMAAAGLAPNAAALMDGVLKMMLLTKLKITTGLLLVVAVLGATTSLIACRSLAGPPAAQPTPAPGKGPGAQVVLAKEDEKPPVDRGRFRYDGKDFAHWQDVLRNDLKPEVRMEALKALGAFGVNGYAEEATATIFDMVRGYDPKQMCADDWNVLQCANQTLARLGAKALAALTKAYDNGQKSQRLFVVETLRLMTEQPEAAPLLLRAAKDKDVTIRCRAVWYLGGFAAKTKGVAKALVNALSDPDDETRRQAAAAIEFTEEATQEALPTLSQLARKDPSPAVRRQALKDLLTHRPDPDTLVPLVVAVLDHDSDQANRSQALQFIEVLRSNNKNYAPALLIALKNPNTLPKTRLALVKAVDSIGPAAKAAAPGLIPALLDILANKDTDPALREATIHALKHLKESDGAATDG